jgi:hypothetical protein
MKQAGREALIFEVQRVRRETAKKAGSASNWVFQKAIKNANETAGDDTSNWNRNAERD